MLRRLIEKIKGGAQRIAGRNAGGTNSLIYLNSALTFPSDAGSTAINGPTFT